jgi:hypothetical protein
MEQRRQQHYHFPDTAWPLRGAVEWDKSRPDRWMRVVVTCGFLLVLAACGGAFAWLTHDNKPEVPAPVVVRAPEAERQGQQEAEAKQHELARQEEEAKQHAAVGDFVRPWLPLLAGCPVAEDPRTLQRREKVLIWDATTQAPGTANNRLPAALRGQVTDGDLTLAVILARRNAQVRAYGLVPGFGLGKEIAGYQVEMDVGLVDVAEKKVLGRVTLTGDDPPETILRKVRFLTVIEDRAEYGDTDGPLALWLEHRPRTGQPDRIGEALRKVPDCRTIGKVAPRPSGKVLIWDLARGVPSSANQYLPEPLRGTLDDQDLTVAFIAGREHTPRVVNEALVKEIFEMEKAEKKLSNASSLAIIGGTKVFREELELCLVTLTKKEALGTAMVEGAILVEPLHKDQWHQPGVVGNSEKEIARWIGER